MKKKFRSDEELDRLMDEQFIEEARMLEEALLSNEAVEDEQESDEKVSISYEKLVQRLRAEGIYEEDEDSGDENSDDGKLAGKDLKSEDQSGRETGKKENRRGAARRGAKLARAAGFVLVCFIGVFAVSMTSEGNRRYFISSIRYWTGNDAKVVVGNDENNDKNKKDEDEAVSEIERILEADVPEFCYRPSGFEFKDFKADSASGTAWMEYRCGKEKDVVLVYMSRVDKNSVSTADSIHGNEFKTITIDRDNIEVYIEKVEDDGEELPSYCAKWEREDVIYQISGRMEWDVLSKLIKNIVF